jgi:GGDEF domain-containing protein
MDETVFLNELQLYDKRLRESEEEIAHLQDELQGLQRELIFDPETRIHSPAYFQVRLQEEIIRSERYRHFLSLVLIHVNLSHNPSTQQISREIRQIGAELMAGLTRRTDLIALYRKRQMVVLLPETDPRGCQTLLLRYQAMFPNNGRRMTYSILCYPNDASNLEMATARLDQMSEDLFRGAHAEESRLPPGQE